MITKNILNLIDKFKEHYTKYKDPNYNETQTRREFIDPLFKELGWDIDNENGFSENYKDVIHEDRVKIGSSTKSPDYSFRIGGQRKFFVEAKKPSVDLKNSKDAVFQLRRYGWTAGLTLCILTDFEEFCVYQTNNIKPSKEDNPTKGRVFYCRFDELQHKCTQFPEFQTNWDFISGTFTKEAILKGRFDKFADKKKKSQETFDEEFLKSIQGYRKILAENIVLRNKEILFETQDIEFVKEQHINDAVRKTIDRLVFLRIAEDRGIEEFEQLLRATKSKDIYKSLLYIFDIADQKYNAGLFDSKDDISRQITIDDKVLKLIIQELYDAYSFEFVPLDILGSIYERFLGDTIRLEKNKPIVETKPEVRKAGGVYYTPEYIVNYIVENTIGEALKSRTLKTVGNFRIVDPACGSGAFLIVAYEYIMKWYVEQYSKEKSRKHIYENEKGGFSLTLDARKRILKDHIFGVDIDFQAVEVTKLSLLLKCLEGVSKENIESHNMLFHERALPNINSNIKCGNSLISTDYKAGELDWTNNTHKEEILKVNAFDWQTEFPQAFKDGGFDCVVGNPPYGASFIEDCKIYLKAKFSDVHLRQIDSYNYFISQTFKKLLHTNGSFGCIVPNTLLFQGEFQSARKLLLQNNVRIVLNLGDGVFKVSVPTCILCVDKINRANVNYDIQYCDVRNSNEELKELHYETISTDSILQTPSYVFGVVQSAADLIKKIASKSVTIEDIAEEMASGISTGGDKIFKVSKEFAKQNNFEEGLLKPVLVGRQMDRYKKEQSNDVLIYTNRSVEIDKFPNIKKYLEGFKEKLSQKRETKQGKLPYWCLHWHRYPELFTQPKIIFRQTADSIRCVFDSESYFCLNSILVFKLKGSAKFDYLFLMAILNSKLSSFVYRNFTQEKGRAFAEVKPQNVRKLFVPTTTPQTQEKLATLAQKMLDLNQALATAKTENDRKVIERQIAGTDALIDRMVYEIYGLTEEEIKIVEGDGR